MKRYIRTPLLLILLIPAAAWGRATSFDTLTWRPATDQGHYLNLYGADNLGRLETAFGLTLDYAREPLSAVTVTGAKQPVVQDLVGLHPTAAIGLFDWLEAGINPNVALLEKFFDPATGQGSTRFRMGDLRLNFKVPILPRGGHPVGIAFVPYLDIPTGSGSSFVGNNSLAGGGLFAIETPRLQERLTFGLNLGYYTRNRVSVLGSPFDDLLTFGLGGNFLVVSWLELIADFKGGSMVDDLFSSNGTPFEGGGGARFFVGPERRWQVTTAISAGAGAGLGNPSIRGIVGLAFTPPRPVKGVKLQESVQQAFQVYELKDVDEMEELRKICPEKKLFNPEKNDPRCLKLYLRQ